MLYPNKLVGLAASCMLLNGCGPAPGVYEITMDQAAERLERADVDGLRAAWQCGVLIHFSANRLDLDKVEWRVRSSNDSVFNVTVKLVQVEDGVRADIIVPPSPKGGEMYDGNQFYPRPALNQPIRPALNELVNSALQERPFDPERVEPRRGTDRTCNIQRAGLEEGVARFSVNDRPGEYHSGVGTGN